MKVAVIPARGGSKRIPRKNIKDFCGKPMIAWSIEVAKKSQLFDRIIVSTDDVEIAEIAKEWGAEIPFMRPPELADDYANTLAVMAHSLSQLSKSGNEVNFACCLYATAPFVRSEDLIAAYQLLINGDWQYVFGATHFDFPIQRAISLNSSGEISMIQPEYAMTRSQDLPEALHDAGQFCWGKSKCFIQGTSPFSAYSSVQILPRYLVQDIDTPEDWINAELMFKALNSRGL